MAVAGVKAFVCLNLICLLKYKNIEIWPSVLTVCLIVALRLRVSRHGYGIMLIYRCLKLARLFILNVLLAYVFLLQCMNRYNKI